MSSNSELTSLVNGIVTQRSAKLPQIEAQLKKLQQIEAKLNNLKLFSGNADFESAFAAIPFDKTFARIAQAKRALERAQQRLARTNIRIAVAGKARQGKSQLLQMLTGLGNEQIPTGDTTFCTAARSRIINTPSNPSATVHFLSESDFLEKKIWPSYLSDPGRNDALGLSPRPGSIQAFLSSPLPELSAENTIPSKREFYDALKKTRDDMCADSTIAAMLGSAPLQVSLSEVAKYVTKDKDELPNYYHVVDYVEIHTPFTVGLPDGMEVFDLPGLGEMTANIRETMLNAVKNDADIVLFLRKPVTGGDGWKADDYEAFDMLKEIYRDEGIQPNDWVSLILNLDTRPTNNNEKNVESLRATAPNDFNPIVCNCGSQEAVRKIISENMQSLLANAERIDSVCIQRASTDFSQAMESAKGIHSQLEAAKGNVSSSQEVSDLFDKKFKKFMGDLRFPFQKDIDVQFASLHENIKNYLQEQFLKAYQTMEDYYKDNEANEEFPAEFPIFSRKWIEILFKGSEGPIKVVEESVRNQLWSIVELMRNQMTESCETIREFYFNEMIKLIVDGNEAIQNLVKQENASSDTTSEEKLISIANAIERIKGISAPKIIAALKDLLKLKFSYEDHILPIFYDNPTVLDFDPSYGTRNYKSFKDALDSDSFKNDLDRRRDALYNWMKETSEEILASMLNDRENSPNLTISHNIILIIKANYRNFANQFIWGETVEKEWKAYANNQKFVLWSEFNEMAAKVKEFQELQTLVKGLGQAINA